MVPSGHALPHRTHEEDRPLTSRSPRTDPQLFPGSEAALKRRRRRLEQQGQSHYAKILWLSYLPLPRTRPLSLTWQAARASIHPRVFLTNQTLLNDLVSERHGKNELDKDFSDRLLAEREDKQD